MTNKDDKAIKYCTEAYISEIHIGIAKGCEIKLKPTDDFCVKIPETNRELIALVEAEAFQKERFALETKVAIAEPSSCDCNSKSVTSILACSTMFFTFFDEGDAAIVNYDLMLSLKQQHAKVRFEFDEKCQIVMFVVK